MRSLRTSQIATEIAQEISHPCTCMDAYICMVCKFMNAKCVLMYKNLYVCICIFLCLKRRNHMYTLCLLSPHAQGFLMSISEPPQEPTVLMWCTASQIHRLGFIQFLLPSLAHCLLHLFVLISLLLKLPSPAS